MSLKNRTNNFYSNPRLESYERFLWSQVAQKPIPELKVKPVAPLLPTPKVSLPTPAKAKPDPVAAYKLLRAKNELKVVRENLHEAIQKAESIESKLADLKKRGIAKFGSSFTFGK